ncbi:hypothetical protein KL909_004591 [Ogataea angusta]|nr:hypothetical protein KL909_004591 [Ogataea angusta]
MKGQLFDIRADCGKYYDLGCSSGLSFWVDMPVLPMPSMRQIREIHDIRLQVSKIRSGLDMQGLSIKSGLKGVTKKLRMSESSELCHTNL